MIHVDESDPVGEVELSFPYRDVQIKRGVDAKQFYELQEEIGRGKFGTVYKCKEKATGLALAAKFIGCPKKEDKRNVEREVDIMRSLQHPRLIQLYDAFENGKNMCVVLELIQGGELFERVIDDDFVLTEKSCTVFMRQICEGVAFIHKQNILHLDMKPENILCLTKAGNRIKIIDFGLARKYDPDKKLQVLFGTPEFVAPEVVNFDQIGYGTDMWSVGVICYVLLSGLSPFMGGTDIETMSNVTIAKYDFDDDAFQEISDNAKDFIRSLLLKDMNERMSAEQCLNHMWLRRKPQPPAPPTPMDTTKDNLRQFVERWNDHPNSPYIFEMTNNHMTCRGGYHLNDSLPSLAGMSPSPCGSVVSSVESDDAFQNIDTTNNTLLMPPSIDHFRRASDSTCVLKGSDVTERINLAEEIKKLSDKLFQLSTMSAMAPNDLSLNVDTTPVLCDSTKKVILNNTPCNERPKDSLIKDPNNCVLPKDHPLNVNCGIPWRRTKHRINNMSRDVPLLPKNTGKDNSRIFAFENANGSNEKSTNSPSGTKDLLLKLLEHWDGPQGPMRSNSRHSSFSSEWTENDSLGQKTISSLNTFFQSRAARKKVNPFHQS